MVARMKINPLLAAAAAALPTAFLSFGIGAAVGISISGKGVSADGLMSGIGAMFGAMLTVGGSFAISVWARRADLHPLLTVVDVNGAFLHERFTRFLEMANGYEGEIDPTDTPTIVSEYRRFVKAAYESRMPEILGAAEKDARIYRLANKLQSYVSILDTWIDTPFPGEFLKPGGVKILLVRTTIKQVVAASDELLSEVRRRS